MKTPIWDPSVGAARGVEREKYIPERYKRILLISSCHACPRQDQGPCFVELKEEGKCHKATTVSCTTGKSEKCLCGVKGTNDALKDTTLVFLAPKGGEMVVSNIPHLDPWNQCSNR